MCGIRERKTSAWAPGRVKLICTEMQKSLGGEGLRGKIKSAGLNMLSFK